MPERIRVLVVEDHAVVREGLCALFTARPDMEVVGDAADGVEAVVKARALQPDVILMDLVMPRKDGIEAIQEIRESDPRARILVLTSFAEERKVYLAIRAGAQGYLLKDSSSQDLIQAIRAVHMGQMSLKPNIALKAIRELSRPASTPLHEKLTRREREVLILLGGGLSNQVIADRLCISERTVTTHVSNILSKLQVPNRVQAALYAVHHGLVPPVEGGPDPLEPQ